MRRTKKSTATRMFYAGLAFLWVAMCLCSVRAQAQATPGNNAVYPFSGSTVTFSDAFVDASVFDQGHGDVCADIFKALSSVTTGTAATMVVIDARGIQPGTNICASSPFLGIPQPSQLLLPSIILLPAGLISIQTPWVLPDRTRIIGQGADPTLSGTNGTILQAASNFPTSAYMVVFGSTSLCSMAGGTCNGIGVESLTLDGNTVAAGIQNAEAQERGYVNHVSLRNFVGTGLDVETVRGQGQNSGPYSNITFLTSSNSANCVTINGIEGTRGIHNINCVGGGGPAGIYLEAGGNTLEDISLSNFEDGIRIGDTRAAGGNVLLNITGASSLQNVVHISHNNTVNGLSILQVYGNGATHAAIQDDQIPTSSGSTLITDNQVAIYAIGESMGGGYSRFTTAIHSAHVPIWLVGRGAASGTCTSNLETGTLYSDMASSDPYSLYLCNGVSWVAVK